MAVKRALNAAVRLQPAGGSTDSGVLLLPQIPTRAYKLTMISWHAGDKFAGSECILTVSHDLGQVGSGQAIALESAVWWSGLVTSELDAGRNFLLPPDVIVGASQQVRAANVGIASSDILFRVYYEVILGISRTEWAELINITSFNSQSQ